MHRDNVERLLMAVVSSAISLFGLKAAGYYVPEHGTIGFAMFVLDGWAIAGVACLARSRLPGLMLGDDSPVLRPQPGHSQVTARTINPGDDMGSHPSIAQDIRR